MSILSRITSGASTLAKNIHVSQGGGILLGRQAAGAGKTQEIAIGSGLTLSGLTLSANGGTWGNITGTLSGQTDLQTALDAKINRSGGTFTGAVTFQQSLYAADISTTSFAAVGAVSVPDGSFTIAKTTGLQTALDGKSSTSHTHTFSSLTSKPTTLAGYGITDAAASSHTHALSSLTQSGAFSKQVVMWSGGNWVPSAVSYLDLTDVPTAVPLTASKVVANAAARLALNDAEGFAVVEADTGKSYMLVEGGNPATSDDWTQIGDRDIQWADVGGTTAGIASAIAGASSKTTPADNDEVAITDSAASGALKRLSWANIKATLKLYFDTLYMAVTGLDGVMVTKANGTRRCYVASADTDAARGLALEAAFAAAVAGDTIDLAPGNYDVAKATSTVIAVATHYSILAGMTIRLNGARLYHGASFNGAVFFGADAVDGWSILGPGVIEGTAATSSGSNEVGINTRTSRRWLIHGVTTRYFKNTGIQANSSSYTSGDYSTGKVSTGKIIGCNMDLNNIGFANYAGSEYISLIGCTFNKNLTGCDIYAGNTRFLGCEANYNTNYALRIRDGGNDGHGIWNGGSINHNTGFAVAAEANMDNGFTFTGAHLYADSATSNKIQSLGGGLTFVGCIIDSPFYASATPSGINSVIGSHFPISAVAAVNAVADLSSAERLKWVFDGNYSLTGGYANNDTQIYVFADNSAALTGGLTTGRRYRQTTTNLVAEVV